MHVLVYTAAGRFAYDFEAVNFVMLQLKKMIPDATDTTRHGIWFRAGEQIRAPLGSYSCDLEGKPSHSAYNNTSGVMAAEVCRRRLSVQHGVSDLFESAMSEEFADATWTPFKYSGCKDVSKAYMAAAAATTDVCLPYAVAQYILHFHAAWISVMLQPSTSLSPLISAPEMSSSSSSSSSSFFFFFFNMRGNSCTQLMYAFRVPRKKGLATLLQQGVGDTSPSGNICMLGPETCSCKIRLSLFSSRLGGAVAKGLRVVWWVPGSTPHIWRRPEIPDKQERARLPSDPVYKMKAPTHFFGIREDGQHGHQQPQPQPQPQPPPPPPPQELPATASSANTPHSAAPPKKKRNLPGNPSKYLSLFSFTSFLVASTSRNINVCFLVSLCFLSPLNFFKKSQPIVKSMRSRAQHLCECSLSLSLALYTRSIMLPDPDAEVIALSPKTLLATNRFVCEVCNKGFQREQNLQLHRRGHNLPWKLKQKNPNEVRRRVYLCPEPTCVHHDPSRALGDLTGIKKHYCRKHGEKKWKCDKCSKRYAVQSDWKAHSKICGTREYRCDCGTLFSRRDSFITHRAFCDALAQESARLPVGMNTISSHLYGGRGINLGLPQLSSLQDQAQPSADLLHLRGGSGAGQFDHLNAASFRQPHQLAHSSPFFLGGGPNQGFGEDPQLLKPFHGMMQLPDLQTNANASSSSSAAAAAGNLFNLGFFSNTGSSSTMNNGSDAGGHFLGPDQFSNAGGGTEAMSLFTGDLMSNHADTTMSSLYNPSVHAESVVPQMSATALLQKAAQMGATSSGGSGSSMLRGLTATFSAGGGGGESSRTRVGNENHFQDIMNSLANGNGGVFGGFNQGLDGMGENKLHRNLSMAGFGGSDRLTRDFLGVGGMMRSMVGGIPQREQQHLGIDTTSSMDHSEMKSGSSTRSLGGGRLQ
ncbi:C2H2 zinc finger protein [Musa troglodytarum]|uniref:Protein EARLY HEADING DATE 2 n=1 Tax=Musa troglodytarum TaxID=320322 RepID=A0A9E7J9C4_9LILI|nr:C2H2 zinc finger protein [Musa troglodytarum]